MTEAPVISSQPPQQPGMDYALLRREAIDFIEKLSAGYWTDYNNHDPGITILEALCYAITDLSYRLNFDIRDILAEPPDGENGRRRQFFTAREILTVNPVTIEDFRKLIIDVDGVRDAWLETATGPAGMRGFYHVYIEPEYAAADGNDVLIARVRARLAAHRNLCEDFLTISVLPPEDIKVSADISVSNDADATLLLDEIDTRLAGYISPEVPLLTLDDMFARGYSAAEIFEGPRLEHGFIDFKSLQAAVRKTQLHASDLIHLLQTIPGVKTVGNLKMSGADGKWHSWVLDITPGYTPRWAESGGIRLFKGNTPCYIDEKRLKQDRSSAGRQTLETTGNRALDLAPPAGNYRGLDDYETIQHELPLTYGVGHFGLPEDVPPRRKAQANQLRGYLMLFDQVMVDYLSQLEHVKDLFAPYARPGASYFAKMLPEDVEAVTRKPGAYPGAETFTVKLLKAATENGNDMLEPLAAARQRRETLGGELQEIVEEPATARERNNRFLNHLLARFAEEFADISLLYRKSDAPAEYLAAKEEFIQKYPLVSAGRARAFNYSLKSPVWDSENVSVLEQRIALKLGITGFRRRRLSVAAREGFHFIENILLLPANGEKSGATAGQRDNFSFHVSFVFPDWIGRFRDEAFRRLVEATIWAETPAHIRAAVHWRGLEYIKEFEKWYEIWQRQKAGEASETAGAAGKLIELLGIGEPEETDN